MFDQTASGSLKKIRRLLKWQPLLGLALIIVGLILTGPFLKPYLYYAFSATPLDAKHPLKKADNRIFIPSIKLSAPLYEAIDQLDHGIIFPYGIRPKSNTVLEGHNIAKHGPLFSLLYLVKLKDEIVIHYQGRRLEYEVTERKIVSPKKMYAFKKDAKDARLTLITCYPPTSTAMRLIVIAKPS